MLAARPRTRKPAALKADHRVAVENALCAACPAGAVRGFAFSAGMVAPPLSLTAPTIAIGPRRNADVGELVMQAGAERGEQGSCREWRSPAPIRSDGPCSGCPSPARSADRHAGQHDAGQLGGG